MSTGVNNVLLTTGNTPITTGATNGTAITYLSFTNDTGGTVTYSLHIVKSGGSESALNRIVKDFEILAKDTQFIVGADSNAKIILGNGDFISAIAASGSAINCTVTGLDL